MRSIPDAARRKGWSGRGRCGARTSAAPPASSPRRRGPSTSVSSGEVDSLGTADAARRCSPFVPLPPPPATTGSPFSAGMTPRGRKGKRETHPSAAPDCNLFEEPKL